MRYLWSSDLRKRISGRGCGDRMMDRHIRLIIMLLLVNTVITAIYLLLGYIRKTENVQGRWMKAVVMLLCPVIGPAFLFFLLDLPDIL